MVIDSSVKVTIMGLGLNGGGLASALFFAEKGAQVTVTDLRSREILAPSMKQLEKWNIHYTLGEHREEDFINADIVIKNPAVPSSSPWLKLAKRVESDISVFLTLTENPVIALTGSKGKSTTVSAVYEVLKKVNPQARLGGNITVSPLSFINELEEGAPVVLELSSWQLADLRDKGVLKASIAGVTNIMHDHQNSYDSMDDYADDKGVIFSGQDSTCTSILNYDDAYREFFKERTSGEILYFSAVKQGDKFQGAFIDDKKEGWVQENGKKVQILDSNPALQGEHHRQNLLCAALILYKWGVEPSIIREGLAAFKGIAHRFELFASREGVDFYNDSAATIPDAVCAALESFTSPVRLICGGTDKELEFDCIRKSFQIPLTIHLLEGTGTDKMMKILDEEGISYNGPYPSLKSMAEELLPLCKEGESVLFSPGATSFGMFLNEFDRGNQFKELITEYCNS